MLRNLWAFSIIFYGHFPDGAEVFAEEESYPRIAAEVREICERHDLPYNTGSLSRQLGSVVRKIFRLALPGRLL